MNKIGTMSIDAKSLKFKLWIYFLLFTGLLLAILWSLQVFFLNNYYQDMKIRETNNAAARVESLYKAGEFSEIRDQLRDIYRSNDMYIEIQTQNGIPIYIPNIDLDSGQSQDETGSGILSENAGDVGDVGDVGVVGDAADAQGGDAGDALSDSAADDVAVNNAKRGNAGGDEIAISESKTPAAERADNGAGNGSENADEVAITPVVDAEGNVVPAPDKGAAVELEETTAADAEATPHLSPSVYRAEIENLYKELVASGANSFTKNVTDPKTGLITLEYAAFLTSSVGDRNVLYIFSPLYPMQSTIDILQNQLIYVTIIAMIMALIISLLISRRISEPIENITKSAEKLGEGEYGVVFDGGHYSEISKLADTLTYTSLELAKSDNLQKDVIANVSHDLRTPLTMITSYAEMIHDLSGSDPDKRNAHLQVIIDEAERLNKLVTDFLEISRMQSGVQEVTLTLFSLKELIENVLQSYTGFVEKEGFKLVFISSGKGVIRADEERVKQVIDNLVTNAFKYSGQDRTVEVKMFDEEGYVRCEVSDHGIGIPKKDLKYIWERYYRASTNYKRTNSTGLGLSIVKQILLLHGANFGVESALKKGSTFWFEIKKPSEEELLEHEALDEGKGVEADGETSESDENSGRKDAGESGGETSESDENSGRKDSGELGGETSESDDERVDEGVNESRASHA
ncbi:MAG: HAMP domain-containing histidine kinase [Clostridiales Family XIII bacterium]|jgi:signal transduction histidine kinase|nr:HAMP domain-containing histidine kinase [Clostridiales Family XIII bacterium]